jgi:hypothetical protein
MPTWRLPFAAQRLAQNRPLVRERLQRLRPRSAVTDERKHMQELLMVEQTNLSAIEAAILTEGILDSDGCAHLRRPYNGAWVGDIKMFRNLEQRSLMQFVDYQELPPAKDRVRRSRITDAGRAALAELK